RADEKSRGLDKIPCWRLIDGGMRRSLYANGSTILRPDGNRHPPLAHRMRIRRRAALRVGRAWRRLGLPRGDGAHRHRADAHEADRAGAERAGRHHRDDQILPGRMLLVAPLLAVRCDVRAVRVPWWIGCSSEL